MAKMRRLASLLAALYLGCTSPPSLPDSSVESDSSAPSDSGNKGFQEFLSGEFEVLEYVENVNSVFEHYPRTEDGCYHSLDGVLSLNNLTTGQPEDSGNYYLFLQTNDSCTGLTQTIEMHDVFGVRADTKTLVLQVEGIGFLEFYFWYSDQILNLQYTYWNNDDPVTLKLVRTGNVGECNASLGHCYEMTNCSGEMLYSCISKDICVSNDNGFREHLPGHLDEVCESEF